MKIAVLGAGSWGLAMAKLMSDYGHEVHVWARNQAHIDSLNLTRTDANHLPGIHLREEIFFSSDFNKTCSGAEILILATPSSAIRSMASLLNHLEVQPGHSPVLVSLTKGIEQNTLLRMSQILIEDVHWLKSEKMAVLSGPSHAEEVSRGVPTTVVVACSRSETALFVQKHLNTDTFRVYSSSDVLGVELCGALKNVIAIATGVLDGLGLGDNTKGALMTRGLAEMSRLGEYLGAHVRTFSGLAGMGDLITTCMSRHSRNRFVGEKVGLGQKLPEVLEQMTMVAEGVYTALSAYQLSQKFEIEMPITQAVYEILYLGKDPRVALIELMGRNPKAEGL